jgi:hypothetical protein
MPGVGWELLPLLPVLMLLVLQWCPLQVQQGQRSPLAQSLHGQHLLLAPQLLLPLVLLLHWGSRQAPGL